MEFSEDHLYTEEVKKQIYFTKARLPKDFKLQTSILEDVCIVIHIDMGDWEWRTVEDRLAIALELERLKTAIGEAGVWCLIDKPKREELYG